ncbi:hypothetical protein J22TS3_38790 [Paenibacillus sp. J22TS3]|nr:hypothetical protein J22TS3_38790 [Paenibacillus sp. J22TS3]
MTAKSGAMTSFIENGLSSSLLGAARAIDMLLQPTFLENMNTNDQLVLEKTIWSF